MFVDEIDGTLVAENDDFQTVLSYFKESRRTPKYIERGILRVVMSDIHIKYEPNLSLQENFQRIPLEKVKGFINDINHMFSLNSKADYYERHLSYLLYYLPVNLFKVWKPLIDLQTRNTLKAHMRILDIGTGPGSIPIGIIEYYKELAKSFAHIHFSLSFVLIEAADEFLPIARRMIAIAGGEKPENLEIILENVIKKNITAKSKFGGLGTFDIISMSNFLHINEGDNSSFGVEMISALKGNLDKDGSLIIIDTGEQENVFALKRIRNEVIAKRILNIYSPCIGIWEEKVNYHCQCFNMVRCFWKPPELFSLLFKSGLKKGSRENIPFQYVILRKDYLKKYEVERNHQHFTKLKNIHQYKGQKINIKAIIRTVIKTDNGIFISLCDGSCSFDKDEDAIWMNTTEAELQHHGIIIPLIAAEKIILKHIEVEMDNRRTRLIMHKNSSMEIRY